MTDTLKIKKPAGEYQGNLINCLKKHQISFVRQAERVKRIMDNLSLQQLKKKEFEFLDVLSYKYRE